MILKALYDYYKRSDEMAPVGMEYKELAFLIVIDEQGNFVHLEDCRLDANKFKVFLVPKAVSRASNPVANFCWDNCSYVLNFSEANLPLKNPPSDPLKLAKKEEANKKEIIKNERNYQTFLNKVEEIANALPKNELVRALCLFYQKGNEAILSDLQKDLLWNDFCKNLTRNVSFRINGSLTIVPEDQQLVNFYLKSINEPKENKDEKQICLITGATGPIVKTTSATHISGSQATAKLVSFQVSSGYDSYGKAQGDNAPISRDAEFAYTTALNHLLEKDSKNMFRIASRTYVFWASVNNETGLEAESSFFSFLNPSQDNPDADIKKVEKVFKSIFSGILKSTGNDKFYILGLAPNAARLAVVYWKEISIKEFAGNILKHFDDMEISDYRFDKKPYKGVYQLLSAVALQGKVGDVQPNLPEEVIKSIFQCTPYPYTLYSACLRRIHAEQKTTICRVGIIKAYLNRKSNNYKKISIMLDPLNTNVGYVCGRLFATLEYLQKKSSGIDSIRQRYLNAASTTPATVFGNLMNLSVHHEEKLNAPSLIFFKRLKNEIVDLLSAEGFPAHLDIQDQGRFFVGYHHQMAEFFKKKETENSNENLENE